MRGKLKARVEKHLDLEMRLGPDRRLGRKQALQMSEAGFRHDSF